MEQTTIQIVPESEIHSAISETDQIIEITDVGIIGLDSLCRLCSNRSDNLISIYEGEGLEYQLQYKMNQYLPFQVEQVDSMPNHCCYQCASTLLSWHELYETSMEADRRLKALQQDLQRISIYEEQEAQTVVEEPTENCITITTSPDQRLSGAVSFSSFYNSQKTSVTSPGKKEPEYITETIYTMKTENSDNESDIDDVPLSERVSSKKFSCGTCYEKFKTKSALLNHLAVSLHKARRGRLGIIQRYYCDNCDVGFSVLNEMEAHKQECKVTFVLNNETELPQDTLALAAAGIIKSEMSIESYQEENNETGISESNQSIEQTATKYHCPRCILKFALKADLTRHIKLRHSDKNEKNHRRKKCEIIPQFYCDVCPKGFTRRYDMQKHRKQLHPDVLEKENFKRTKAEMNAELLARCRIEVDGKTHYKCEHCSRTIHLSYNFLRHQTIHTGVRTFFCHLCGKSFRMSSGLNRHIKELHYGVKNHSCEICGRCFASKNTRDDHMNIHTGARPFVCDQCGKSFKQKASLYVHKIFHTNDKPFVCRTCGKRFRRSTELKVHGWLHTGYKPHECTHCGSRFRLAQDLKRHQKTHSKDFQVECEECGARFGQARYLKSHMKTHRKKETTREINDLLISC